MLPERHHGQIPMNLIVESGGSADDGDSGGDCLINREDLAALCVQSLLSLDWASSRIISVKCNGPLDVPTIDEKKLTPQREWCVNSQVLESQLASID